MYFRQEPLPVDRYAIETTYSYHTELLFHGYINILLHILLIIEY